jgi:hypothetical protein
VVSDQREVTTLKKSLDDLEALSHFACTSTAERGDSNVKVAGKRAEDAIR